MGRSFQVPVFQFISAHRLALSNTQTVPFHKLGAAWRTIPAFLYAVFWSNRMNECIVAADIRCCSSTAVLSMLQAFLQGLSKLISSTQSPQAAFTCISKPIAYQSWFPYLIQHDKISQVQSSQFFFYFDSNAVLQLWHAIVKKIMYSPHT